MRTTQLLTHSKALIEAKRCLGCYDPPCSKACPAHVDIPGFIFRFREENLQGAGELLYAACPLAATCGLACPTEVLCEGACTLNRMGQTAVRIGSLQAYVASQYKAGEKTGGQSFAARVAVVGAGPSGLGCAVELNRLGHTVDVFDRAEIFGGLVDRVLPDYRLPHSTVEIDMNRLAESGIKFHFGKNIDAPAASQLVNTYDAVFVGAGLSGSNVLDAPGAELKGVVPALDFLEQARFHAQGKSARPETGRRVVVIGGGNVALDAAVMARKLGAERVVVLYRRSKDEMPGWESEYLEAASLGVEFRWLSVIDRVEGVDGHVNAVQVQAMRFKTAKMGGRRGVEPDPDEAVYSLPCDQVITALGQRLDHQVAEIFGLMISEKNTIAVDEKTFQSQNPKIFSAGEAVNGGSTIVNSMSQGMQAARAIHNWWTLTNGGRK